MTNSRNWGEREGNNEELENKSGLDGTEDLMAQGTHELFGFLNV